MTYTNKHGLPQPIYEALTRDPYRRVGDISVTQLIKPPLMVQIEKRHAGDIVEDASDRVWSLLGQSVHAIIERQDHTDRLSEERLVAEVFGWTISGKPDLLEPDDTLTDYKVTSVWAFLSGVKPEWAAQLNMYRWLYMQHGFTPKALQIVAILRDWIMRKAETDRSYPDCQVHVVPVEVWTLERIGDFIRERVHLHQAADNVPVDGIPVCTPAERWEKPTVWAVKKRGNKRALPGGLCGSRDAAEAVASLKGFPCDIEERPGECTRCLRYCSAAPFCPYGRRVRTRKGGEDG